MDLLHIRLDSLSIRNSEPVTVADGRADKDEMPPYCFVDGLTHFRLSASGRRGAARRMVFDVVTRRLSKQAGQHHQWSVNDAMYDVVGGAAGSGARAAISPAHLQRLRTLNPIIWLFGAGDPFMKGSLEVGDLVSVAPIASVQGKPLIERTWMARSNPLFDGSVAPENMSEHELADELRVLNRIRGKTEAIIGKKAKAGRKPAGELTAAALAQLSELYQRPITTREEAEAAQAELDAQIKGLGGSDVSPQQFLSLSPHIPRDVAFRQRIAMRYLPPYAIGLWLAARARIARFDSNRVGGRVAAGFGGRMSYEYAASIADDEHWRPAGTVRFVPPDAENEGGMTITPEDSVLAQCYRAWCDVDITQFDFRYSGKIASA